MPDNLSPEYLALPLGRNGLPDLLILTKDFMPTHLHGIVHAYIVPSARGSEGYWSERYNADGDDAVKWARLFALEKVRQRVVAARPTGSNIDPVPVELKPFTDWEALSVQRVLGFYPRLMAVAGAISQSGVSSFLREKDNAYNVTVTPITQGPSVA